MKYASMRNASALLLAGLLATACNEPSSKSGSSPSSTETKPADAQVAQEITAKAKVISIDQDKRLVGLQDEKGNQTTVWADPAVVRNFSQIAIGDTVAVRYRESLAVSVAKPGTAPNPPSVTLGAGRAEPGQKPGAGIAGQVNVTVRIESVDTTRNIVTFTPPGGGMRAVHVQRPEGVKFIQGLKPGDMVDITYTEAAAVSVEKQ